MQIRPLLELLADGNFHSGQEIGECLGVSRTSVWKMVNAGLPLGIDLDVQKGVGYRIPGGLDLLDEEAINHWLASNAPGKVCYHQFNEIESTNAYLMDSMHSVDEGVVHICAAEMQTDGRGRRGKVWCSPFGQNLYVSIAFHLSGGGERLSGLSLVVGIAVVQAIEAFGFSGVKLKWPNDIYVHDEKLGGILVELTGSPADGWKVVVGVGLNVYMKDGEVSKSIDQRWTSLVVSGGRDLGNISRNAVLLCLLDCIFKTLAQYELSGFSGFMDEWHRLDYLQGKVVQVLGTDKSGVVLGVQSDGALRLRMSNGGNLVVNAGEVSVRALLD
ncbi:MAG: biotin--[acetyl-CoA-carboxylase] ligase [Hahellaceae bacterium]|nr:biotin--[acetyl-CoA-carboxylase] ligase [Hahellaceae bacterium]MCP5168528.1 biotin--[acetyl-CoA-carboxylase] ligase [Hahellaceae bacterium]